MTESPSGLQERIDTVSSRIEHAASLAARLASEITLVAVSKTVDRATVNAAYDAGLRSFGENRVADARAKFAEPLPTDVRLHLIGQLQTNKASHAVDLFDLIESVDRASLIAELQKLGERRDRIVAILLQVNIAGEEQKAGSGLDEVDELVDSIRQAANLDLRGLMTIAPLVDDIEATRPVFAGLRSLRDDLVTRYPDIHLPILSMGMSNDLEIAIQEGATHVRVGRAIFG